MSDNIKYYYLKLKDNFFDSEEMKMLESLKNGTDYQNFYLKMCLLSLKSEGRLIFKDYLPYDEQMLSTVLRVNIDTVKTGIEIFIKMGLVEIMETGLIFMTDIQSLIGTGSTEGDRKKAYRLKIEEYKKTNDGQMSGQNSDIRTPEIEIELKKERDKKKNKKKFIPPTLEEVREYVELKGLKINPKNFIDFFTESNWIDTKGKKVTSWKLKILTWNSYESVSGKSESKSYKDQVKELYGGGGL